MTFARFDSCRQRTGGLSELKAPSVLGGALCAVHWHLRDVSIPDMEGQGAAIATGLGPSSVTAMDGEQLESELQALDAELNGGDWAAVGLIGLDYRMASDDRGRRRQRRALSAQLDLASRHQLPVVVGAAGACNSLIRVFRSASTVDSGGIVVDYEGSPRQIGPLLMHDLDIAFGPSLWGDESRRVQAAVGQVPDDRLLAASSGLSGSEVELGDVIEELAQLRGAEPASMATVTAENGRRRLGID